MARGTHDPLRMFSRYVWNMRRTALGSFTMKSSDPSYEPNSSDQTRSSSLPGIRCKQCMQDRPRRWAAGGRHARAHTNAHAHAQRMASIPTGGERGCEGRRARSRRGKRDAPEAHRCFHC